jgi:hypothetical protein
MHEALLTLAAVSWSNSLIGFGRLFGLPIRDRRNGTRQEFLCTVEFRDRESAEPVAACLKEGHTQIKCQWELETEVFASTEGTYRVAAAKTRGGQMYRIGEP